MKKNNTNLKIIVALTLIISIAGLSLGFANYASNLKIESSGKFKLDDSEQNVWLVTFSSFGYENETDAYSLYDITIDSKLRAHEFQEFTLNASCSNEYEGVDNTNFNLYDNYGCEDVEATDATVNKLTVSGIEVTFKNLSSGVMYYLPVGNYGLVDAYLKSITFSGGVTCTSNSDTMKQSALETLCDNIDFVYEYNGERYTSSVNNISENNMLERGYGVNTRLYIGVNATEEALTNIAVGEITVNIPDITLNYSSVN